MSIEWLLVLLLIAGPTLSQSEGDQAEAETSEAEQEIDNVDNVDNYPYLDASGMFRELGYEVEDHQVRTTDGYELSVIRPVNTLIKRQSRGRSHYRANEDDDPVLFLAPTLASSEAYVARAEGAGPKDLRSFDLKSADLNTLLLEMGTEPSAKTLPTLLLNFGYDVWMLNRRGSFKSQHKYKRHKDSGLVSRLSSKVTNLFLKILHSDGEYTEVKQTKFSELWPKFNSSRGQDISQLAHMKDLVVSMSNHRKTLKRLLKSIDKDFWNFSLDEQAEYDLPETIDYILKRTRRRRVKIVCYSAGGAVFIFGLAARPELADKISRAVLWAPAAYMAKDTETSGLNLLRLLFQDSVGALPPPVLAEPLHALFRFICLKGPLCRAVQSAFFGYTGDQQPQARVQKMLSLFQPTSLGELGQLGQLSTPEGRFRKYRYLNEQLNVQRYGDVDPPRYDLSRIRLANMSFYAANKDALVSIDSVKFVVSQLSVPYKFTEINESGTLMNHLGFTTHSDVARLVNFPSLLDLR